MQNTVLQGAYYGSMRPDAPMVLTLDMWEAARETVVEFQEIERDGRKRVLSVEMFLSEYEFVSFKRN